MKANVMTLGSSAVFSFLFILPFMIMEVVNRRHFEEDFPFVLFFGLWFNAFGIMLILLPVVRGGLTGKQNTENVVPAQRKTLLASPTAAAITSLALILLPLILFWLGSLGWAPMQRLINGPNPEHAYLPGLFISYALISLIVVGGVIAGMPVARTLRAGGRLFAHPVNVIIVGLLLATFAFGLVSLIVDQWPCFIGVPVCD